MDSIKHIPENKHFTDEQWADFVRGVVTETSVDSMRMHLASGCPECNTTARCLDVVAQTGMRENGLHIPQDLVQQARELFIAPNPSPGLLESWRTITAELIREASLTWQPAGVRSPADAGAGSGERKMFRAGDYVVDLQVEAPSSGKGAEIVGQIANENEGTEDSLGGIIVEMVIPGRTLTGTSTNRFGEFVLECPAVENAVLRFALRERRQRIELPLRLRT